MEELWTVHNVIDDTLKAYTSKRLAMDEAERIVGNSAAASPADGMILYGPGNGETSVLLQRTTREWLGDIPVVA